MANRKPVDEWGLILQKQAEYNKIHEIEQKSRFIQEQEGLRKGLEYQQQLRELDKKRAIDDRDRDARDVALRANWFKEQEIQKRQQETMLKKQIGDELINHQHLLKQREAEERNRVLQEEQERLRLTQKNLEDEEKRRIEKRLNWAQEQQAMKQFREYQDQQKRQQEFNEKQTDIEQVQQRKEREEQKERDYRDYYRKVNENQLNRARAFSQVISKQSEKDIETNMWISKNVEQYQQQQAQKEEYERMIRNMNSKNVGQTLKSQMEFKEYQKQMAHEEYKRTQDEVSQRIELSRRLEQEKEAQRQLQKQMYREQLAMQTSMNQDARLNQFKLSEQEKIMNKAILDESVESKRFQRGANEILKPQSTSFGYKNDSYDENAKKFFGADSVPNSRGPQPISSSLDSRKRFNPITGVETGLPNTRTSLRNGLRL